MSTGPSAHAEHGPTRVVPALIAAMLLAAATLPYWANPGVVFLAGVALTEALFAMSWNLLFGFTGLISFGQAAFFAIGAYSCGALLKFVPGLPFPVTLVASALLGTLAAAFVGAVALRRSSGIYFAMLTLALGEVLRIVITYIDLLGRDDGLSAIPRPVIDLGFIRFDLGAGTGYYWFLLVGTVVVMLVLRAVVNGRIGRVLRAVRDDPDRLAFLGVDVHGCRLLAFIVAGCVAATAGALQVPWTQIVTPDAAGWLHSTEAVLNTLLGGSGSLWGPAFGAAIFAVLSYGTRNVVGISELVTGGLLLVIVLVAPSGLVGLISRLEAGVSALRAPRAGRAPAARPE